MERLLAAMKKNALEYLRELERELELPTAFLQNLIEAVNEKAELSVGQQKTVRIAILIYAPASGNGYMGSLLGLAAYINSCH